MRQHSSIIVNCCNPIISVFTYYAVLMLQWRFFGQHMLRIPYSRFTTPQVHGHGHIKEQLQWSHNERDGVSSHRRLDCLKNSLFRHRSMKTARFRATGLCEGKPPVTDGFPSQKASKSESIFIWWRHHDCLVCINQLIFNKIHSIISWRIVSSPKCMSSTLRWVMHIL